MANIVPVPIVLNDIVLIIGADNYEAAVSKAEFVPTTPTVSFSGMTPGSMIQLAATTSWVMNLDFAQDHATAKSLSLYLLDNNGQNKSVTLKPKKPASGTAPTYTITAMMIPTTIGGAVDTIAASSVTLPCSGQPVRTVA
ncbi:MULTISPECIES: hypothetical protein [unclassified Microbacterium]|uniref:hypothetical protein n=1 Tax=unclassified Microbacterium TaxID=2609290 RepID=UPI003018DEB4